MQTVKLQIHDEVNCSFIGLSADHRRYLNNKSKIFNPSLRFTPAVRLGRWDGKTPYFSIGGQTYINLLEPMIEYLATENIEIELEDLRTYNRSFEFSKIDNNYLSNICWPVGHPKAGEPIILRDHQTNTLNIAFDELQGIFCLPTASGKSLVTAIMSKKVEKYGRSIVIVPNKDLIEQTEAYYKILGLDVGVYYGDRKDFFKTHTICTWQSLEKLRQRPIDIGLPEPVTFQKFMSGVVATIVDECHGIAAEKLSGLLTKELASIPIRWALTGTVPKEPYQVVNLTISIGQVVHKLTTIELQDKGILSQCNVKVLQLIDTKEFTSYSAEYDYLVSDKDRVKFVSTLISKAAETGNVLVLVGRKETGKMLEKLIPGSIFLSGATKSSIRKEHYDEVKLSSSKILVATAGIATVGVDIPRLHHLFMFELGKSYIKTVQAIGRVLRTSFDKNHATIWDICSTCKFSKRHLTSRKKWYNEQQFPYSMNKLIWKQ